MEKIKFGAAGRRGIIAEDFTFTDVAKVVQTIVRCRQTVAHREKVGP